jgi:IS605 OrfB family transposase
MSLTPGKRIALPLCGNTPISGTLTLVITGEEVTLHISQELKKTAQHPCKTQVEAVDFGYTEVMTDTQGMRYGTQFGLHLTRASEHLHQKMRKRHKLHALDKKMKAACPASAKRLGKYNLGKKKHHVTTSRFKATLEREINTAIHQLVKNKKPTIVVTEDLRHPFRYDKYKTANRKLSGWLKGKLQDRIAFKALAEGFRHEQVNPAYGSQSCPYCEFVDPGNRHKDHFECLHCGHEDIADRIAAQNYARRWDDPEIGRYTPYRQVKALLLDRFHRRLEAGQPATVPGRTLDTAIKGIHPPYRDFKNHSRERENLVYRAVHQRAKRK